MVKVPGFTSCESATAGVQVSDMAAEESNAIAQGASADRRITFIMIGSVLDEILNFSGIPIKRILGRQKSDDLENARDNENGAIIG